MFTLNDLNTVKDALKAGRSRSIKKEKPLYNAAAQCLHKIKTDAEAEAASPGPTADGLIRTMYTMLKTDQALGIEMLPSDLAWMSLAEIWIKSLHKDAPIQRKVKKSLLDGLGSGT